MRAWYHHGCDTFNSPEKYTFLWKGRVPHDEATPSSFFNNLPLTLTFNLIFRWGVIEHPTFGRVPRVVTVKDLKAGQELFCHYMIDMEGAADDIRYHPYIM